MLGHAYISQVFCQEAIDYRRVVCQLPALLSLQVLWREKTLALEGVVLGAGKSTCLAAAAPCLVRWLVSTIGGLKSWLVGSVEKFVHLLAISYS